MKKKTYALKKHLSVKYQREKTEYSKHFQNFFNEKSEVFQNVKIKNFIMKSDKIITNNILIFFNIRELFDLKKINKKFATLINNLDIYNKYIKLRQEFIVINNNSEIKETIFQRLNKPSEKILNNIPLYNNNNNEKTKEKKITISDDIKITEKIDNNKFNLNNLFKKNGELIKKLIKKYHLNSFEEKVIFNGLIEILLLELNNKTLNLNGLKLLSSLKYLLSPINNINLNLIEFNYCENYINHKEINLLFKVLNLSFNSLIHINLSNNNLDDNSCKIIFENLIKFTQIENLNISNNKITSEGILMSKEFFTNNIYLTTLNLSYNLLGSQGVEYLTKFLKNNSLIPINDIDISYCGIETKGIIIFCEYLSTNLNISKINIGGNFIQDEGIDKLCDVINSNIFNNLSLLYIENNDINNSNKLFKLISQVPLLTNVNLKSNNIKNEGVEVIFKNFITDSKLLYLDLSNNNINYIGIKTISTYLNENIALSILILDDNNLESKGCKYINKILTQKNNITELSLVNTNIEKGIKLIFEGISKNRILEKINLSRNNLNNYKKYLIPCINYLNINTTLTKIYLDKNFIDDEFINIIYKNIIKNDIITDVSLKLNEMTDKCINDLKNILNNLNSLTTLNLQGNNLSENNIEEIDKILLNNIIKNKNINDNMINKENNSNKKNTYQTTSKKLKSNYKQNLILDSSDTDY